MKHEALVVIGLVAVVFAFTRYSSNKTEQATTMVAHKGHPPKVGVKGYFAPTAPWKRYLDPILNTMREYTRGINTIPIHK